MYPELPYRSCKYIVLPVIFARFLSHLLYFKLSFLEGFRSALSILYFLFFAVIFLVNRKVKVEFKLYKSVFYSRINLKLKCPVKMYRTKHRIGNDVTDRDRVIFINGLTGK